MAEHGTRTRYRNQKCRCELCRAAKRAYDKPYEQAHRDEKRAYDKAYHQTNRERRRAYGRAFDREYGQFRRPRLRLQQRMARKEALIQQLEAQLRLISHQEVA